LGGGFRLSRSPDLITLHDVIDSVEGVGRWNECAFGEKRCSEEQPCALHSRWSRVRDAYFSLLKDTSVAELLVSHVNLGDAAEAALTTVLPNPQRRPQ
jgi:DNA-binding IscR family transcriptional regulator